MNGRPRRNLTAAVRARRHPCRLCGYPIDQSLNRQTHPLGSVVDEWLPRCSPWFGDPLDPNNCNEQHRICNGIKGRRWPVTDEIRDACRQRVTALTGKPNLTRTW